MIEYVSPLELPELRLDLAKPSRKVVGILKNVNNRSQKLLLGRLNEISFDMPYYIQRDNKLVKNPLISQLRSQYLVRATFLNQSEWYILSKLSSDDKGGKNCNVTMSSLGYQLRNKKIRIWAGVMIDGKYRKESLNAKEVLDNVLSSSNWSTGYIDADFLIAYRSFDFTNTTALDAVFQIADTFKGIIRWDTENKRVDLIKEENVGTNKGFRVSVDRYMKSINKEDKLDEVATRLKVYGQDGLSIQTVNPTGVDYIEDYSHFMRGFVRDKNKNVISSAKDMSDSLCNALLDYNELIQDYLNNFKTLLDKKKAKKAESVPLENKLHELEIELAKVEDLIEIEQKTEWSDSGYTSNKLSDYFEKKFKFETEIKAQTALIDSLDSQIHGIEVEIENLRGNIAMDTVLTRDNLVELNDYIIEEVWEDINYTDPQVLYDDAQKVFEDIKKPKQEITMDIVNFYNLIEGKKDWDRLKIGDKFFVYHEDFDIDIETQLLEIDIGHDNDSISITFSNTKNIERDEDKLAEILYDSVKTSNVVDMGKYKWDTINKVSTDVSNLIENKWESAKNEIVAGLNENVIINERGITSTDTDDPNRFIRIMHSIIGMTNDGGNTFKLAITANGVVAEQLIGKITITENLFIENQSGKYRFDKDGFVIDGGSLTITGGLPASQLDPSFADGLFKSDTDYTNGIRMDSVNGLVVTRNDDRVRGMFNATDGILFQTKKGSVWENSLYYDLSDNSLVVNGIIYAKDLRLNGESILDTIGKIKGKYIDKINTDQLELGKVKIKTAMIEELIVGKNVIMGSDAYISWGQVANPPTIPTDASQIGGVSSSDRRLTYIDANGIFTGSLTADRINGGTINGVTINVNTDLSVGQNIYLMRNYADRFVEKGIYFNSSDGSFKSRILGTHLKIDIESNVIRFKGTVDFREANNIIGLNTTAKFG